MPTIPEESLGEDLLDGADQIAQFIFGDPAKRRKIYHLAETGQLPIFKMGASLCARKSVLKAHIEGQERRAVQEGAA